MRQRFLAGAPDAATRVVTDALDELVAIFHGDAQQVGDDQQREGAGEALDPVTLAGRQELVEHLVGEHPHGVLVLLEALGGDQPHQQGAVVGVGRRVEGGQLVAERQLVAMLLDQLGDVRVPQTFEGYRKAGERAGHRNARRPCLGVVEHGAGLVPAGHHGHAVVVLPRDGALLAQCLVVGVRVLDEPLIAEEIHLGEVVRHRLLHFNLG